MKLILRHQLLVGVLVFLALPVQTVCAQDVDAVRKINDAVCVFIYLVELSVGAIAAIIIIFMGLKYLSSAEDSDARYTARTGIIGAFVGILIVVITVPVVNIIASGLIGTVECGFFPSISGVDDSAADGPVDPNFVSDQKKSPDIAAKGFLLTKSLEEIKAEDYAEFPLYFQLSNVGTESSPLFMNTVSMSAGIDLLVLCKVQATSLKADGKILNYPCITGDMEKVKQMLSSGKTVTLTLNADLDNTITADTNQANNNLSQDILSIPVLKALKEKDIGDMGGIKINYLVENP
jgi:hypothetical protein